MNDMADLTGKKFGRLTAIEKAYKVGNNWKWRCICDCGNEAFVYAGSLTAGHTKSCGCYFNEVNSTKPLKHGQAKTRLYHVWYGMLFRCENSKATEYSKYGGRGIKVCDEWHDFFVFKEWAGNNGHDDTLPKGECTIDRIDVNGNYEPSNCRWANVKEQSNNRRSSVYITYDGETLMVAQWADKTGMRHGCILERLRKGWTPEQILTTPVTKGNRWLNYGIKR